MPEPERRRSRAPLIGAVVGIVGTAIVGLSRTNSVSTSGAISGAIDGSLALLVNGLVGAGIGGVVALLTRRTRSHATHQGHAGTATRSDKVSKESTTAPSENYFRVSEPEEGLSAFLEQLKPPVGQVNGSKTKRGGQVGYHKDPTGRWLYRYFQGDFGEVGWTNLVSDGTTAHFMDSLDTAQLRKLDQRYVPRSPASGNPNAEAVAPSGWYPDPAGHFKERHWSGRSWTCDVRDHDDGEFRWPRVEPPSNQERQRISFATPTRNARHTPSVESNRLPRDQRLAQLVQTLRDGLISRAQFESLRDEILDE